MEDEKFKKLIVIAGEIQKLFPRFYLAGGTGIRFRYNHRVSEDLDFFSYTAFSKNRVMVKLRKHFGDVRYEFYEDNADFFINDVKVSFVFFPFKNVKRTEKIYGVKVASDYDLFLNKIYVAGRRVDWKDPYDAAFLLSKNDWGREQIKKDFEKKFPGQSFEIYLGAILQFDDYGHLPIWVKKRLTEFAGIKA